MTSGNLGGVVDGELLHRFIGSCDSDEAVARCFAEGETKLYARHCANAHLEDILHRLNEVTLPSRTSALIDWRICYALALG